MTELWQRERAWQEAPLSTTDPAEAARLSRESPYPYNAMTESVTPSEIGALPPGIQPSAAARSVGGFGERGLGIEHTIGPTGDVRAPRCNQHTEIATLLRRRHGARDKPTNQVQLGRLQGRDQGAFCGIAHQPEPIEVRKLPDGSVRRRPGFGRLDAWLVALDGDLYRRKCIMAPAPRWGSRMQPRTSSAACPARRSWTVSAKRSASCAPRVVAHDELSCPKIDE